MSCGVRDFVEAPSLHQHAQRVQCQCHYDYSLWSGVLVHLPMVGLGVRTLRFCRRDQDEYAVVCTSSLLRGAPDV